MKYIYYDKEKLKKGEQWVVDIRDEPLAEVTDDVIVVKHSVMPNLVIYVPETDTARVATTGDLIELGVIKLDENEFYDKARDIIGNKLNVSYDPNIKIRKWSDETNQWVEGATISDEIDIAKNELINILIRKNAVLEAQKLIHIFDADIAALESDISKKVLELDELNLKK